MWLTKQIITGDIVELLPLNERHVEPLEAAVKDGESWKLWYANVPKPEQMTEYVTKAVTKMDSGDLAFAVKQKSTGNIVGTTRYYQVDQTNKRALIGYTWYADAVRRTAVNTETKLLLLTYLFEQHEAIAVEFRTHFFNAASRKAIERLGAKQDGILRNHQIMPDGSFRDTVVYSIIASEWPAVKRNLQSKLSLSAQQKQHE